MVSLGIFSTSNIIYLNLTKSITWLPNKYFLRTSLNIRYIFPKHFAINMFRKIKQEGFIELQRHNIKLASFIWLFSSAKWGEIGSVEWNLKSHWFLCYFAESISYQTIWFQNSSFKKKSLCKQFGRKELKIGTTIVVGNQYGYFTVTEKKLANNDFRQAMADWCSNSRCPCIHQQPT